MGSAVEEGARPRVVPWGEGRQEFSCLPVLFLPVVPYTLGRVKGVKMATRKSNKKPALPTFEEGETVILPANVEEGWPEQKGTVTEVQDQKKWPGMYIVEVEPDQDDPEDDGIREVHASNMKKIA